MKPFIHITTLLICTVIYGVGFSWAEATPQDNLISSSGNSTIAGLSMEVLLVPPTAESAQTLAPSSFVESPNNNDEVVDPAVEIEKNQVNLILVATPYVPKVTVLKNQNGVIHFKYEYSDKVYAINVADVKNITKTIPEKGYLATNLRMLIKNEIVTRLKDAGYPKFPKPRSIRQSKRNVQLPLSATNEPGFMSGADPDEKNEPISEGEYLQKAVEGSSNTADINPIKNWSDIEPNMVNLVVPGQFYVPNVTVLYNQNGVMHFKYGHGDQVYSIKQEAVSEVSQSTPENGISINPRVLLNEKKVTLVTDIGYPMFPKLPSMIKGSTNEIKNTFTIEPVGFGFGAATLEYERIIGGKVSFSVGFKFNIPESSVYFDDSKERHTYWGWQGSMRFYPFKDFYAPRGLWFGPTWESINTQYNDYNNTIFTNTTMLTEVGWGFMLKDHFGLMVSPFVGLGFTWGSGKPIIKSFNGMEERINPYTGVTFVLGCHIGVGF